MNFALLREIYGGVWHIGYSQVNAMLSTLDAIRSGVNELPETRYNSPYLMVGNEMRVIQNPNQLSNLDVDGSAIAVIKIDGVIMRNDGASSYGILTLSSLMKRMAKDSRVKAFIILGDSGGGESMAVKIMVDTINEIKQTRNVVGLVPKGGMAASAMYGIISACNEVYCEDEFSIVGSAGTMIQFSGRKANTQGPDGNKHIRLYASKSTKKNEEWEQALNNDNYEVMINELLDPLNERFLNMILENRPALSSTDFEDGRTIFASEGIGTYIDGIKSFEEIVINLEKSIILAPENNNKDKNQLNSKSMTIEELKRDHPATYASIFDSGVTSGVNQEKDRVGAWLAHADTDTEAVIAGINSGENISQKSTQELLVKAVTKNGIANLQADSAANVEVEEAVMATTEKPSNGLTEAENKQMNDFKEKMGSIAGMKKPEN